MRSLDFIDEAKIYVRAGHGGAGSIHFRREKFIPKGGPDGGNGGNGGNIIIRGNADLTTLLPLKYQKHIIAEHGKPGEGGCRTGTSGADKIIQVPLGTIIQETTSNKIYADVVKNGQDISLMQGGRGGLGNHNFKNSIKQSPRYAQPGESGEEGWLQLSLKLLAEVGLVGLPNAGKSTLLAALSAAKPKIAAYPFTTLVPQLGVVPYREHQAFVMADLPGIIKGASEGKGLGKQFLKHIERNRLLGFVLAADTPDIYANYCLLRQELEAYNPIMLQKPLLLIISKIDILPQEELTVIKTLFESKDIPLVFVSAINQQGLSTFKDKVWEVLHGEVR